MSIALPQSYITVEGLSPYSRLVRVLDHAELPNSQEALRVRVENAQRVSCELDKTFDHRDVMDPTTNNLLGYAGVRCRAIGTFYMDKLRDGADAKFELIFGSDLSNYYPNRGLKVFQSTWGRTAANRELPRPQVKQARGQGTSSGLERYATPLLKSSA